MPTFKYVTTSGNQETIENIVIPAIDGVSYNEDREQFHKYVPSILTRFVDGVETPVYIPTSLTGTMDSDGDIFGFVNKDGIVTQFKDLGSGVDPQTPEEIKDGLESLSGDDRLDVSAIKNGVTEAQLNDKPNIVLDSTLGFLGLEDPTNGKLVPVVKQFTFQTLPDPSSYVGIAFVSNVGPHGSLWKSDGTSWGLVNGSTELYSNSQPQTTHTGSTAITNILSIPIIGKLLGPKGGLEISTKWTLTNNANIKTQFILFGSTSLGGVGMVSALSFGARVDIINRNNVASQISSNGSSHGYAASNLAWNSGSVNTDNDFILNIAIQLANSADSATLETCNIRLVRP